MIQVFSLCYFSDIYNLKTWLGLETRRRNINTGRPCDLPELLEVIRRPHTFGRNINSLEFDKIVENVHKKKVGAGAL